MQMQIEGYRVHMKDGSTSRWIEHTAGPLLRVNLPCPPEQVERIEWKAVATADHQANPWLQNVVFTVATPVHYEQPRATAREAEQFVPRWRGDSIEQQNKDYSVCGA